MEAPYHFAKAYANVESIIFSVLKELIIKWRWYGRKYIKPEDNFTKKVKLTDPTNIVLSKRFC